MYHDLLDCDPKTQNKGKKAGRRGDGFSYALHMAFHANMSPHWDEK